MKGAAVIEYTQHQLDEFLACRKDITVAPRKDFTTLHGSMRNDFKARSDEGWRFGIFMRINKAFEEDFSIGLMYEPPGGDTVMLLRCNGPHGDVLDPTTPNHWHSGCHFHLATENNIAAGKKPEAGGTLTQEYSSFPQALRYFLTRTNIAWTLSQFPLLARTSQRELF